MSYYGTQITYGVSITAGGTNYSFHVYSLDKVRELFAGSHSIEKFEVTEQTDRTNERTICRQMTEAEVNDIIWGRTAKVQILGNAVPAVA